MTQDAIESFARKILMVILTAVATKLHIEGSSAAAFASDVADLTVIVWSVWAHWGMKKVPENAQVTIPEMPATPRENVT